jgi:hypothetical protein
LKATKASPPLKTLAFVENEDSFTKKDVLSVIGFEALELSGKIHNPASLREVMLCE